MWLTGLCGSVPGILNSGLGCHLGPCPLTIKDAAWQRFDLRLSCTLFAPIVCWLFFFFFDLFISFIIHLWLVGSIVFWNSSNASRCFEFIFALRFWASVEPANLQSSKTYCKQFEPQGFDVTITWLSTLATVQRSYIMPYRQSEHKA